MSNEISWLVEHYAETGRADRAFQIASEAAATGSFSGLSTLGALLEQTGRHDQASQVLHRLAERYESGGHVLDRFLAAYLQRVGDDRFGAEAEAAFARVFPDGLERVTLDSFDGPPFSGLTVAEDSVHVRRADLGPGAVVVALDGYRVHNAHQYLCVKRFRFDSEVELIAYYQGSYREIHLSLPRRSLAARLDDYPRR